MKELIDKISVKMRKILDSDKLIDAMEGLACLMIVFSVVGFMELLFFILSIVFR
jgi:hypothetical protein